MKRSLIFALALICGVSAMAQQGRSPFEPPNASLHYAPDRTCDLIHIDVTIDVDYPDKTFTGKTINVLSPLRNGITEIHLMAGEDLSIGSIDLNGKPTTYRRDGTDLYIATPPTVKGSTLTITIPYSAKNSQGRTFGAGGGGWHWIRERDNEPTHVGFWTQGETGYNCEWAPTWDYPNDLATSETHCTVPADWDVIGNGLLVGTKLSADKKRKTYDWKLDIPHATYLLTLCGGPFDIKKDSWEGVDLWYVVPRGDAYLIDDSFGHTKDMLSFYSKILGYKYPWPKYAQDAMYDFGGGMENASATTLGENGLTEARNGFFSADSVNSHELGHQWFGDTVTCKDWGDIWLNESFATYMQDMYFEHSRGSNAYDWEMENNMRSYFNEARRYKRPLSTKMYPNADAMFDQHTYPKGGTILHTLRRQLGDEAFFAGLHYYLTKWQHTPVESAQLRRAFIEATGINVEPFWAQWIDKPGHPVIDYTWAYSDGKVALEVKQTQDTSDGTPIYDVPTKVDFIASDGTHIITPIHITKADEIFDVPAAVKPMAVVFDPYHDFLRQIPEVHWSAQELPYILQYGLNAPDRQQAMQMILDKPTDDQIQMVANVVAKDNSLNPALIRLNQLVETDKPELRSFWMSQLESPNFDREAYAAEALGRLPQDAATTAKLRSLVTDKAPIRVVVYAIQALAKWDKAGNADVFKKAQGIKDRRGQIKRAADQALASS